MRRIVTLVLAMLAMTATPAFAEPLAPAHDTVTVHAALPVQQPVTFPFELSALALVAMGTKKVRLSKTYLFDGESYGPGVQVEVPDDFPDLDDQGDVIWPAGSDAEKNQRRSRNANQMGSPPSTGGVYTGDPGQTPPAASQPTVSGLNGDQLNAMTKEELVTAAAQLGITVERQDGDVTKEPLKSDYVTALSATAE